MKRVGLFQMFFVSVVIASLPGMLLIDDASLTRFILPYSIIMLPFVFATTWFVSTQKIPLKSTNAKIVVIITILTPFILFAPYPFSIFSLLMIIIFILLGVSLPFWSRSITLWIYTLGNRVPLPKEHSWLLGENKPSVTNNRDYLNFIKNSSGMAISIGLIIFYLIRGKPVTEALFVMKILSLAIVLGLSLTVGAEFKKRSLAIQ